MYRLIELCRALMLAIVVGATAVSCGADWQKMIDEALERQRDDESQGEQPTQPATDDRAYRALELDNKLVVLLIHDPDAKKSAAAMSVNVGYLEDPIEHQGLAHYLEHALYLGTAKYPEVGEYEKYMTNYQGYDNAYTSAEFTNYFFELNHEGFEGAIDRLAQLFIEPLFPEEYLAKELTVVNAEHQKNLQNDYWRTYRVSLLNYKDGHPAQKFSTGNSETLKNATRQVLLDFYNKHYSANVMRLATISTLSLDEQEELVTKFFSAIKNRERPLYTYDSDMLDDNLLPQQINIKPLTDIRFATFSFEFPPTYDYWQSKPTKLLSSLLGDEGKGSLLSILKARGYATALSSGTYANSFGAEFETEITLTEEGVKEINEIVALFFSYIAMLKKEGLKKYYYQENKQLAQINHDYRDPLEGANAASFFARLIHRFPPLAALENDSLFFKFAPLDFNLFLNNITPEKLKLLVIDKSLATDKVEEHYGVEYSVNLIAPQVYRKWQTPKTYKELHYPAPNIFIPSNLSILANDEHNNPYKLLNSEQVVFWFQQDTYFLQPKASVYLKILTDKTNSTPREKLISTLYVKSLLESINEWKYPIATAGIDFSIERSDTGIAIDIDGYADKIPLLVAEIGKRMQTLTLSTKNFNALKDKLKQDLANEAYDHAYLQVINKGNHILELDNIDNNTYADMIDSISLADVRDYVDTLFAEAAFEGIAYGNLDGAILTQQLTNFVEQLDTETLPAEQHKEENILKLSRKYTHTFTSESNNHSLIKIVQMGERSPELDAQLRVIDTHIGSPFYTELRSKQQLGYIVHAGLYYRKKVLGLRFIVQSADYAPTKIDQSMNNFFPLMAKQFAELSDEELETYKQNITNELQKPEKTIADHHDKLKDKAFKLDGDFDYTNKVVAALQQLTKADIVAAWGELTASGQLNVSLFAKGTTTAPLPDTLDIIDIGEFKKSQPIYQ